MKKRNALRARRNKPLTARPVLSLENLEQRVLLDVAGWWDELGFRSGSGGGITVDQSSDAGEIQMVLSGDSDPVAIWIEGTINEFVDTPITFDFNTTGNIYARQYAGEELGWWDLSSGSGDTAAINTTTFIAALSADIVEAAEAREVDLGGGPTFTTSASQISAASGPDGQIVVVWVADAIPTEIPDDGRLGLDSEIYAKMWDGQAWIELSDSARGGGLSDDGVVLNEKPDVVISDGGDVFVSYTAIHPLTNQREIVVKKFSPALSESGWVELVNEDVETFGENATSGVSADLALSFDSAIALDLDNMPIVVWTSLQAQDQAEIYGKKWDGDSWEEIGLSSASDFDSDGLSGISNDTSMSIQPDIAVANNGDIIVTWVGWNDWLNYDESGEAGVYVKSIQNGVWFEYDTNSASGAGIAPQLAWYYNPQIDTDSQGNPFIGYQGFEQQDVIDRDNSDDPPGSNEDFPDFESPLMAVYAGYYDSNVSNFVTLHNAENGRQTAGPISLIGGIPSYYLNWMPNVLVGPQDELLFGFTWRDDYLNSAHHDDEIFIQQWDSDNEIWAAYGRASNSNGNDLIGDFASYNIAGTTAVGTGKLALIDFDNDPATEPDIIYAKADVDMDLFNLPPDPGNNDGRIFLYNRQTGVWSLDADLGIGRVFDVKSEPEAEFNVDGNALAAFLDDQSLLPMVYEWAGGQWNLVGGTVASAIPGNEWQWIDADTFEMVEDWGITVQAGPDGQIFLAYLSNDGGDTAKVITRLWDPGVGVWADAGGGSATIGAPLVPLFYANFDGITFNDDDTPTVTDVGFTLNDDGSTTRDPLVTGGYQVGQWYFDIDPNDAYLAGLSQLRDLITGEIAEDAGISGGGFLISFDEQEDDDDADDAGLETLEVADLALDLGPGNTLALAGQLDHQIYLHADSQVIVEMSFELETTADATGALELFLVIDGNVIDFSPAGPDEFIEDAAAGGEVVNYSTITIDTTDFITQFQTLAVDQDNFFTEDGQLRAGLHTVSFLAEYDSTGRPNGTDDIEDVALARMDNLAVYQRAVETDDDLINNNNGWKIEDGDIAGNNDVGPGDPGADLQALLHIQVVGDTQGYDIDVNQPVDGDMRVSFRYHITGTNEFTIKIDDIPYDIDGEPGLIGQSNPITAERLGAWWNGDDDDPEYSIVQVDIADIEAGAHTVTIEVTSTVDAVNLRIDNLTILGTAAANAVNPIATLIPSAGGGKDFALGLTAKVPGLSVYATAEQDPDGATNPVPDGEIVSFNAFAFNFSFENAYYRPSVVYLDTSDDSWNQVGLAFVNTTPIDFSGVGVTEDMPSSVNSRLEDVTIGPNSLVWIATLHATSEWVDTSIGVDDPPDGINDQFDIHPFDADEPFDRWLEEFTLLDVEVWVWQGVNDPFGGEPRWVQNFGSDIENEAIGHPRVAEGDNAPRGYSNAKLIGSANQLPTVTWTNRFSVGDRGDAGAQRFQNDGTWGALGPVIGQDEDSGNDLSDESVQNTQFWSSLIVEDMIVNADGYPIVAFNMGHLAADGIREFRPENTLPDMRIVENSGDSNDNRLEFGSTANEVVNRAFTMFNDGPDDLLIYSVQFGGLGSLAENPFTLGEGTPAFPILIPSGANKSINVRFNPDDVPAGEYSSILLINNSDPIHPTHPFSHFYEINLDVEVLNEAEIDVSPLQLIFEDTTINTTSPPESIVISNEGDEDSILNIDQWFFGGNSFRIDSVTKTIAALNQTVAVGITNVTNNNADDVQLAFGDSLEIVIVFEPTMVQDASEVFFVSSDDSDEELTSVILLGDAISGANIVVEQNAVIVIDEGTLDFGSVITGTTATINLTIRNNGSTDLTVFDIVPGDEIIVGSFENIIITPGSTIIVPVSWAPTLDDPENSFEAVELEDTLSIFNSDPDTEDQFYEINFIGLAVPEVPLISASEVNSPGDLIFSLDFGSKSLNTSESLSFQINNIGGDDLVVENFAFTTLFYGQVENPFSVIPDLVNTTLTIPDGDPGQTVTVTFTPTAAGVFDNTLRIFSNDPADPIIFIDLTGSATNPLLEVTDSEDATPDMQIDFGGIGENQTSMTETITLRNVGDTSLTITNWVLSDANNVFSIDAFPGNIILAPNATREIDVDFTPNASPAIFNAIVTVESDDPNNLSTDITLTGTGVLPGDVGLMPIQLDFVPVNAEPLIIGADTAVQIFTVTNTGQSNLVLKGVIIVNEQFGNENLSSPFKLSIFDAQANKTRKRLDPDAAVDDILLVPNQQQVVSVAFEPTNVFNDTVYAQITTNDPQESSPDGVNYVELSGESVFAIAVGNVNGLNVSSQSFLDASGDLVQVKLTGGGHALVVLENGFGSGADIARIEMINTTSKTKLSISTKGSSQVGRMTGGAVKNITLKDVTLGDMDIAAISGNLKLTDVANDAVIRIAEVMTSKGLKVTAETVGSGAIFDVEGSINQFQADSFRGTLMAQSLDKARFDDLDGAAFSLRNELGSLDVHNNMDNTLVLTGYDFGADGLLGGGDDTQLANSLIGSVRVRGTVDDSFVTAGIKPNLDIPGDPDFFNPDAVLPGSIKKVQFANVNPTSGGKPYGVIGSSIEQVIVGRQNINPGQGIGDFQVESFPI